MASRVIGGIKSITALPYAERFSQTMENRWRSRYGRVQLRPLIRYSS
jgi:hypothetical protein